MSVLDDLSHQKTTLLKRRSALLKQLERCSGEAEERDRKISGIEGCEREYDLHKNIEIMKSGRRKMNAI